MAGVVGDDDALGVERDVLPPVDLDVEGAPVGLSLRQIEQGSTQFRDGLRYVHGAVFFFFALEVERQALAAFGPSLDELDELTHGAALDELLARHAHAAPLLDEQA